MLLVAFLLAWLNLNHLYMKDLYVCLCFSMSLNLPIRSFFLKLTWKDYLANNLIHSRYIDDINNIELKVIFML